MKHSVEPARVIYVHPKSQMMMREIIPLSLPAMIERIPYPVRGYYHSEITADALRSAEVLIIDAHWYLTLPGAIEFATLARRINRDLKIIGGGLTASTFASQVSRYTEFDFVIRGDAEDALAWLVAAILDGGDIQAIPNIVHADFSTAWKQTTSPALFDQLHYENWDFFPSFKRDVLGYHRRRGNRVFSTHPFSMAFKGCPLACDHCIGSPRAQQTFFKRPPVIRSADVERDHLEQLSRNPDLNYVNIFWDVAGLMPESYTEIVYGGSYNLRVYYELAAPPKPGTLDLIINAFRGGTLAFSVDDFHTTSLQMRDRDELVRQIRKAESTGRYVTQLEYSQTYCDQSKDYADFVNYVAERTNTILKESSFWWSDIPMPETDRDGSDSEFWRYADNRARRYTAQNFVYRSGIQVHKYAPEFAEWCASKLYAHGAFSTGGS